MRRATHAVPPQLGGRLRGLTTLGVLAGGAAAAGVQACVQIDPAPNGVASSRLAPAPPSVAIGDSLRDSLGNAYRVQAAGFDAAGNPVPTASFRYAYAPTIPDTTAGNTTDTALVVDSATGAVRATRTWVRSSGRVVARLGSSVQLLDTIQIVPRPDSIVVTAASDTVVRFSCADSGNGLLGFRAESALGFRNASGPYTLVVRGDSVGATTTTRVPVRRWLVKWSVDTPTTVPTVNLSSASTTQVPAIAIVSNSVDRILGYDTTDATGTSSVRLRLRPYVLGPRRFADSLIRVTLRADVIAGRGEQVHASPSRGFYRILLSRVGVLRGTPVSCP